MAVEITGVEQWQAWQDGVLPGVERVGEGLWSLPVPIPDNPLRYVLVYALETWSGLVLVDAGWDSEQSWQALTRGITATGHDVGDVTGVLVTHHHADHLGLANRVRQASGAWVAMHRLDAEAVGHIPADADRWGRELAGQMAAHGAPPSVADAAIAEMRLERFTTPPRADLLLEDGEKIRAGGGLGLEVVWTPGHTPGHSCFHVPERRLLFSGDHVLPRITPQISVLGADWGSDPLTRFLLSLDRLGRLDVDEVLPAHEYRFRGLGPRLDQMGRHHAARLAELLTVLRAAPGATGWWLCQQLSWSRPWDGFSPQSQRFALGETLAHLVLLRTRGEVRDAGTEPVRWWPTAD
ncbi:MBL fold metallo-hydrolase [Streptomyces sp. NPDC048527]|uniref:MBL fold metallo-hydrolase n=1 Tax=Streptomyces sp. NPDC048527 TaxID=3365568 RepID=UPI00371FF533